MSSSNALYSSSSLKAANAQPYSSMKGKLDPVLLEALKDVMGFDFMTPVQSKVLSGLPTLNSDCLVQAKTGTGKTTAFLLPAIQSLLQKSPPHGEVSILVLSPTRELALQIAAEATRLVSKMRRPVEVHTAFGGTQRATNLNKFMKGDPKILVATPGRLNDYLSELPTRRKFMSLQTLILDEADAMLEAGFLPDILRILRALPPKDTAKWQGMCFSATVPPKIKDVLSYVLKQDYTSISTIDAAEPPTLARVPQYSVIIPSVKDTFAALLSLINAEVGRTKEDSKIIVFGTTANLVALYTKLFKNHIFQHQTRLEIYELHSRLSQPQRTRTTNQFRDAETGIMFATDVIGRGMDFPNVSLVVQVGLPSAPDAYVHRVGRTARAGKDGRAVILLTQAESFFCSVNRQFKIIPYPASDHILKDTQSVLDVNKAMKNLDDHDKQKAYSAYLGFMKGFMNKLNVDTKGLVGMANELALKGMGCGEVPGMEKKTIGKMGLKGVPGIRYVMPLHFPSGGDPRTTARREMNDKEPAKRIRHQGPPESSDGQQYGHGESLPSHGASGTRGDRGGSGGGRGGRQRKRGTLR